MLVSPHDAVDTMVFETSVTFASFQSLVFASQRVAASISSRASFNGRPLCGFTSGGTFWFPTRSIVKKAPGDRPRPLGHRTECGLPTERILRPKSFSVCILIFQTRNVVACGQF